MKSTCVGVLSIIELKNARWNTEIAYAYVLWRQMLESQKTSCKFRRRSRLRFIFAI